MISVPTDIIILYQKKLNQGKLENSNDSLQQKFSIKTEEEKEVLLSENKNNTNLNQTERFIEISNDDMETVIHDSDLFREESINELHFDHNEEDLDCNSQVSPQLSGSNKALRRVKHKMLWSLVKMNKFAFKTIQGEIHWREMNLFQRIIFVLVDIPFGFLRKLTIPPSNDEQWDRRFAVLFPILSVTYFFMVTGFIDFTGPPPVVYWILIGVGFISSIVIYYTTKQQHAPRRLILVYALIGFFMSLLWIFFIANVLIDVLSLLGVVFTLKPAFLGVTVLAWGNSVGDMIANLAISKKGYAKMAMTGCIAGPLFNLLFGLGVSLGKEAIKGKISKFSFDSSASVLPMV